MGSLAAPIVSAATEGIVDEAVLRRIVHDLGGAFGDVHTKGGKAGLDRKLVGYNRAAFLGPWVVIRDLDDEECASLVRARLLPNPAPHMCFRIAVREIESWIMGDAERLARLLALRPNAIPTSPDEVERPKRFLIDLARQSSSSAIRRDMVPRPRSGGRVGPGYASRIIGFVEDPIAGWRPAVAAARSDSLARAMARIASLLEAHP